jgi:XRE family transcriptional regulator, aerobic/anaerobic benzoate catabolism transcriptional regulator
LIGLPGGEKTTIGALLGQRIGLPFIELDREVEHVAGIPLSGIVEVYRQAGLRRHERASFERVLHTESALGTVVAALPRAKSLERGR